MRKPKARSGKPTQVLSIQQRSECANRGKLLLVVTSRTQAQASHGLPFHQFLISHPQGDSGSQICQGFWNVPNMYVTLIAPYRCFSYHNVGVVCRPQGGHYRDTESGIGMHTDPVSSTTRSQGPLLYWLILLTRWASRQDFTSPPKGIKLAGIGAPSLWNLLPRPAGVINNISTGSTSKDDISNLVTLHTSVKILPILKANCE